MSQELTRRQFNILEALITPKSALSQRQLEDLTGISLGSVNRTMKELTDLGYVADGMITNEGVNALEPYRAKKAVFIAAGFGTACGSLRYMDLQEDWICFISARPRSW